MVNGTHGQLGKGIANTGTDHNPQANSVILAGKGIIGDQVVGATDLDDLGADGHFAKVSGAHNIIDAVLLKKMGKPFDFERGVPSSDLPSSYEFANYITSASVVNTLLSTFSVV